MYATDIAMGHIEAHDVEIANVWNTRAYDSGEFEFFFEPYWSEGAEYSETPFWKALTQRSRFKDWQVAGAGAAHS